MVQLIRKKSFLAIRPMVEQIAPAMEKLNQNRFHAEAGKLEVLVQNEKRITELCSLHKINFEKSEAIGEHFPIGPMLPGPVL